MSLAITSSHFWIPIHVGISKVVTLSLGLQKMDIINIWRCQNRKSITRVHTGLPKLSHADMSSQGKYDEPEHHSARVSSIFLSIVWFLLLLGVTIHVNLSFRSLWTKVLTSTQVSIKPGCSDSGLKCQQQKKI